MSTISALAEESDTLIPKQPQASLKFQAHIGAANASTKAKKTVGAVAAAALILGVLAATSVTAGVAPTTASLSSKSDLPAPGWDTCRWVKSNSNRKGEHRVGHANSPWQYPEEFPVDLHFCAYCADDN